MPNRKILFLFASFWSAITGLFLVILCYGIINQLRTLSFAQAQGTVDRIEQTIHQDSDSTTYGIDITYHLTVNDHLYTGNKLRFNQGTSSDGWSTQMLQEFPAHSHPTVYYNPSNPTDSVLIPGIQGFDLFLALFLTPFTVVGIALWIAAIRARNLGHGFFGLRVTEMGAITRVRPSYGVTFGVFGAALAGAAFVTIFIVAFLFGGFNPPVHVAAIAWLTVVSLALIATSIAMQRLLSGACDILLNDDAKTLAISKSLCMPYSQITQIALSAKTRSASDSGTSTIYEVWLNYRQDSAIQKYKIKKWLDNADEARRFGTWLALRLGAEFQDMTLLNDASSLPRIPNQSPVASDLAPQSSDPAQQGLAFDLERQRNQGN